MKPIDQMTLTECLEALRELDPYSNMPPICIAVADRIHDLTRWIPVSERMPTIEDTYRGRVLWLQEEYSIMVGSYDLARSTTRATHWQRITPQEAP
jgi:hypothetical protein